MALAAGVHAAAVEPRALAHALLVAGGLLTAAGVVLRSGMAGYAGGIVATVGLVQHLALSDVAASEAYLAPVALLLVVAGVHARRPAFRTPGNRLVSDAAPGGPGRGVRDPGEIPAYGACPLGPHALGERPAHYHRSSLRRRARPLVVSQYFGHGRLSRLRGGESGGPRR